ncbi:MAG: ribonuclease [Sphingomicrobium sp.]
MPEWLIERGIGETRCIALEGEEIVEARILLDGMARAGAAFSAKLKSTRSPALAVAGGEEYLLPKGAGAATEGSSVVIQVTRERIPGAEPWKRPLARVGETERADGDPLADGETMVFPAPSDRFGAAGWDALIDQARTGVVAFTGGELRISPTPAMTLIDVDGYLPAAELAVRGAGAAAKAIRRLGIGGSIGIDLPTIAGKAARQAAAAAIDEYLPQPFERTAVNGFGFVQIVRPRERASLVELAQDRAAFEARALLRRAALERAGARTLVAGPAVIAVLETHRPWLDALSAQLGGPVGLRPDAALPISAGYAA